MIVAVVGIAATFVAVGATALVYNLFFATPGHSFFDQGKGPAKLESIPAIIIAAIISYKYYVRRVRFKVVLPSIGRQLTNEERNLMRKYKITYNEDYFSVKGVDFDRLNDAVEFAIAQQSLQA